MAKPGTTHVIEIESGIGEPAFIPLTVGQELQPISVGKKGMWRIESARVMDVHAFVYFDGTSLFLQSADESQAASVDGYRVGKAWTELHAPCKIEVGAARLRFRSLSDNAEAPPPSAASRPAAGAPPPQPYGGDQPVPSHDDTRPGLVIESRPVQAMGVDDRLSHHSSGAPVQAIPMSQRPPNLAPMPQMPPMMPMMNSTQPMHAMQQPMATGPMPAMIPSGSFVAHHGPGGLGSRSAPTVQARDGEGLLGKYKELNPQKRLLVIMAPFCLIASAYLLLFDEDEAPQEPAAAVVDAGAPVSSVAQPVTVLPTSAPVKCPAGYIPYTREVNGQIQCVPSNTPLPPPLPNQHAPPTGPVALPAPAPAPAPAPGPAPAPAPGPAPAPAPGPAPAAAAKSLERQAVDAVAVGDYNRAAAIYDMLFAQSNPKNPVYSEAARILRMKADGGL